MGTLKENGDLLGTQKLKKVPMGTRVPKWGPTWEQWLTLTVSLTARYPFLKIANFSSSGGSFPITTDPKLKIVL